MRAALALLLLLGCATAPRGGRAFVESVYRAHDPDKSGDAPWDPAHCRSTFSDGLCALIERDRAEAGDEVPRLDGDPLYDAQDFGVSDLRFVDRGADRVEVTFINLGHPRQLLVTLVREAGGWRIDDITYLHERPPRSLRSLLDAPR